MPVPVSSALFACFSTLDFSSSCILLLRSSFNLWFLAVSFCRRNVDAPPPPALSQVSLHLANADTMAKEIQHSEWGERKQSETGPRGVRYVKTHTTHVNSTLILLPPLASSVPAASPSSLSPPRVLLPFLVAVVVVEFRARGAFPGLGGPST